LKTSSDITLQKIIPEQDISDYVESFWMLHNQSDEPKEVVILPDGRIDLFLTKSDKIPFCIKLLGLGQSPVQTKIPPKCIIFSISFNPIAVEYILKRNIFSIINQAEQLSDSFWNFSEIDLDSFKEFYAKSSAEIRNRLPTNIDLRKKRLFDLIYSSKGAMTVTEMAENVFWSSRQINRYFNNQFGISLKAYCSIIRFRSSFHQLKQGKLFPEENFSDQPHFIREVKKLSGFSPKKLGGDQNDRFVQFLALPKK
jgi:AraC-like DNA-binding protein